MPAMWTIAPGRCRRQGRSILACHERSARIPLNSPRRPHSRWPTCSSQGDLLSVALQCGARVNHGGAGEQFVREIDSHGIAPLALLFKRFGFRRAVSQPSLDRRLSTFQGPWYQGQVTGEAAVLATGVRADSEQPTKPAVGQKDATPNTSSNPYRRMRATLNRKGVLIKVRHLHRLPLEPSRDTDRPSPCKTQIFEP